MNTSLSTVFRILLIRYVIAAKILKLHLITFLNCPDNLHERKILLNKVSCIVPNIFDFNNDQLTGILLYGKEDLDNINDTSILDATINYLIETKRFNAEHFWWTPDVKALTLMLHLKFNFLFIFFFDFFLVFLSFYYFKVVFFL